MYNSAGTRGREGKAVMARGEIFDLITRREGRDRDKLEGKLVVTVVVLIFCVIAFLGFELFHGGKNKTSPRQD